MQTSETKPKFVKINALQAADIVAKLREHFDKDQGMYHEGYSDQLIATTLGVPESSVSIIRSKHFGKLRKPNKSATGELKKEVNELRSMIAQLTLVVQTHKQAIETAQRNLEMLMRDFRDAVVMIGNHVAMPVMAKSLLKTIEHRYEPAPERRSGATLTQAKE